MTPAGLHPLASAAHPAVPPEGDGPGDRLARFWSLRGRSVARHGGVWWVRHRGPFHTSLPFQLRLALSAEEADDLLRSLRLPAISYPSAGPGLPSGHYVLPAEGYGLDRVSRKQRGHVLRGLESCEIRGMDADELIRKGLPLNRDTLARQGREDATFQDPLAWAAFVRAVEACPGMAIHGAFVEGRLATWLVSCREGEWLHLLYKMSSTAELEHHPSHTLDFTLARDAAGQGIRFLGNGCASVLPNEGLDRYKRQLGYELRAHNLAIRFHPWLAPAERPAAALLAGAARLSGADRLAYARRILEGARLAREAAAQPGT